MILNPSKKKYYYINSRIFQNIINLVMRFLKVGGKKASIWGNKEGILTPAYKPVNSLPAIESYTR